MRKNPVTLVRERTKMSVKELAKALGVNYYTLIRIEHGIPANLSPIVAAKLKALGYPGDPFDDYRLWREEEGRRLLQKAARKN